MHLLAWHFGINQIAMTHMRNWISLLALRQYKWPFTCPQSWTCWPVGTPLAPPPSPPLITSPNLHPVPSSTSTPALPQPLLPPSQWLSQSISEGSTLTFDVAQNWISSVTVSPSPSWSVIHAVTNWVACQQLERVNGWLLAKCVCDLGFFFFLFWSDGLWVH